MDEPVTAVATHIHWDHIGELGYYPDFYTHEAELDWLSGGFPLTSDTIRAMVLERCDLPDGYDSGSFYYCRPHYEEGLSNRCIRIRLQLVRR